jgi:ethanolamine utilization microcompartment shell protein EutS
MVNTETYDDDDEIIYDDNIGNNVAYFQEHINTEPDNPLLKRVTLNDIISAIQIILSPEQYSFASKINALKLEVACADVYEGFANSFTARINVPSDFIYEESPFISYNYDELGLCSLNNALYNDIIDNTKQWNVYGTMTMEQKLNKDTSEYAKIYRKIFSYLNTLSDDELNKIIKETFVHTDNTDINDKNIPSTGYLLQAVEYVHYRKIYHMIE